MRRTHRRDLVGSLGPLDGGLASVERLNGKVLLTVEDSPQATFLWLTPPEAHRLADLLRAAASNPNPTAAVRLLPSPEAKP